jgi:GH25 family lysozyme M1 (1,4-beta-N-acetylmuramidase)
MLIVDLSNNNGTPDFGRIKAAGIEGVWLKASEGVSFVDQTFHTRALAARKAGLRVGAYHFARPDVNSLHAGDEAEAFCRVVSTAGVGRRDLRPVLDYERLRPRGANETWIRDWNHTVRKRLGVGPLFYSYPALVSSLQLKTPVGYGLWLASYGRDDGTEHPFTVPAPWRKTVAHQFTSRATVAGAPGLVDLSRVVQKRAVLAHPLLGRI